MKKLLLSTVLPIIVTGASAQCTLSTFATDENIICGQCVTLSAFGNGNGNVAFEEDFNSGSPQGWQFTQTVTIATNTCGVPSPDGTPFMWMGDNSVNPRDMTTVAFDLTLGGTICFEMRYSEQADPTPCEGPDEPDEGVYVQYSTNGGGSWNTIQYYDPNGGYDPALLAWNQYCLAIPPAAMTPNTMIRWHQDAVSGAEYDHWGIDNILITLNDPNYEITWLHDNYGYGLGNPGGNNPTQVCPTTTTTYTAEISDGTNTCTSSITVNVQTPTIVFDLGNDTTACPGECVTLNSDAYVLVSPASTPTYTNAESTDISGGFGSTTQININVQDLNMTNVLPGSILEVCFTELNYFGFALFPPPPTQVDVGDFNIYLQCPDGSQITLVPSGTTTSTSVNGYNQTCFVPGAPPITSSAAPYTGSFSPNEPFDNLAGCTANGVWSILIQPASPLAFGAGTFEGWSITFDDPELTEPVDFTWSPLTNMTNENTLTPTICPTGTETYTLTASDQNGCVTATDDIVVSLANCCALTIDNLAAVQPSCGANDGSITVTVSGQTTGLEFSIDGGVTWQSSNVFANLGVGTYTIQANDDNNCLETETITLSNGSAPVIDAIATVDASCGASDGSLTITASGGSGALEYSIDNGVTFVSGNAFNALSAATYDVVVQDASGCSVTGTATIGNIGAPTVDNIAVTNETCAGADGTLTVTASGGNGTIQYSIDNGATFQAGNVFNNLAAGSYDVVVEDASGCQATATATIDAASAPAIIGIANTPASCGNSDGVIALTVSGGSGAIEYSSDNGTTFQPGNTFNNLAAGNYDFVVQDANGCQATVNVTVINQNGPVVDAGPDQTICAGEQVTLSGSGAGVVGFTWDNGISNGVPFTPAATTTYTVTGTDANGCTATDQVTVTVGQGLTVTVLPSLTSGCAPLTVTFDNTTNGSVSCDWTFSNGATFNSCNDQTVTFTSPGCYDLTLTTETAGGCSGTATFTDIVCVSAQPDAAFTPVPNVLSLDNTNATMVNSSSGATIYAWDFGDGSPTSGVLSPAHTFPSDAPGSYTVTLTVVNADGCTDIATGTVIVEENLIYFVPNTFTPDGDEFNQQFVPVFTSGFDPYDFNMTVYDRWGETVFESNNHEAGWDGTYHGKIVQEGVYSWRIEFKTSKNDERMVVVGHVALIE